MQGWDAGTRWRRRWSPLLGECLDGRVFAVWGLAFKPGTDDMREAEVRATDPAALEPARQIFGNRIVLDRDAYALLEGANALVLVTEWNEYRFPDFERIRDLIRKPVLFDGRNIWSRSLVEGLGFTYHAIPRRTPCQLFRMGGMAG